ncbi:MAG: nodulation protein NfeD [Hyphomicrobiaceae bacterium]
MQSRPHTCLHRWLSALVLLIVATAWGGVAVQAQQQSTGRVLLLDIKGAIGFVSADHLEKALQKAALERASALIVRIDTPGGLVSSTRDMISGILASPVPVILYVAPSGARAASAGTYLAYASHIAAMAPGTHLGAATPVSLGTPGLPAPAPQSEKEKTGGQSPMERKVLNDAIAYLKSLAQLRKRNAEWAEKAVRDAATLTADEALKDNVVDVVAADAAELLNAVDGRSVTTAAGEVRLSTRGKTPVAIEADWKMRVLSILTDPNVAFILLMIGFYGIVFEFWNPGAIAPGVIGGICLLLGLTALSVLPITFGGAALLLLGLGLMLGEAFAPGFGLLGIGGLVAFILGAVFLFDPDSTTVPFGISWQVIAATTATSALFFMGLIGFALRAHRNPVRTGSEEMIGSTGVVVAWDGGSGRVRVHGEIWSARASIPLTPDQPIAVTGREGLVLLVEKRSRTTPS